MSDLMQFISELVLEKSYSSWDELDHAEQRLAVIYALTDEDAFDGYEIFFESGADIAELFALCMKKSINAEETVEEIVRRVREYITPELNDMIKYEYEQQLMETLKPSRLQRSKIHYIYPSVNQLKQAVM